MNYIKDYENLKDKKVLLRLDLNVPLKNGIITDETRINKTLPILNYLIEKNSKILSLTILIFLLIFFSKFLLIGFIDRSLFTFPLGRPI